MSLSILGLAYRRYSDPVPFGLLQPDRLFHLHLLGQTGTGKSTLLHNLIWQDAKAGRGFCLIDPHGDLAEDVHRTIPADHLYWDIADANCRLGYNPLAPVSADHRPLVASGLIESLKSQWSDAWGPRMEHLLRYGILALLEQPQADLRDLAKLFIWKGFRRQVVERITDEQVRTFWKHEFPAMNYQTSADGVSAITNKLGAFLAHPLVRRAICKPKEPLRFRSLMDTGGQLVVNLAKGRLGTDVSNVIGGLITASLMNAALTRHGLPPAARRPFFLYADEFHSFTTESFAGMLAEARKYGLGLILAQQHLSQTDKAVRDALEGNIGSRVVFRVGANDAPLLERLLPPFSAHDLTNQANHRATVQLMLKGERSKPFSASMYPPHR
ncbi:MAG: hypothetical protein AAFX99_33990 [Myxococcota bacterium]